MPFLINNITDEIKFSVHTITSEVLSGIAEEFTSGQEVDVFKDDKLIDIGKLSILYEKYKTEKVVFRRHNENSKLEKEEKKKDNGKEKNKKISRKERSRSTYTPQYKMVNSTEPDVYVNKKFLT